MNVNNTYLLKKAFHTYHVNGPDALHWLDIMVDIEDMVPFMFSNYAHSYLNIIELYECWINMPIFMLVKFMFGIFWQN